VRRTSAADQSVFSPGVGAPGFLIPFFKRGDKSMEMNLIFGIVFFILGTVLMPLGLKQTSKQNKMLLIGASVFSDLIGLALIFKLI
jgi:uncharacterized membrane protein HdeD (DUF308 family)